ncbi:MAG: WGR domain-containing protein [Verrucomicrobiota bacterium]
MNQEQCALAYKEGSSDKVYNVSLEPKDQGWVVNFTFGRRGSTLNAGTKTAAPVEYEKAKKIYEKLTGEKMAKGYTANGSATPYSGTDKAGRVSSVLPQLLNEISENELESLLNNHTHCAQEKHDGRRTLVRKRQEMTGINRKGLTIAIAKAIEDAAQELPVSCIIDGEGIGDTLFAFDLLETERDLRDRPYRERYQQLQTLLGKVKGGISLVKTAWTPQEKRTLLSELRVANREGIVFKEIGAPYKAGRPNSGGSQLKYKFYATASLIVEKVNDKRSVAIGLFQDANSSQTTNVGNVTIPTNHPIPQAGDVIEVRYLYAYPGGSLYQPTHLGIRSDVARTECLIRQIKYKPAGTDTEDEA